MSKKDGPIVVKLVPHERIYDGSFRLGGIRLCSKAVDWLRAEFPKGGNFRDVWERCPRGEWIGWVAHELADKTDGAEASRPILALCDYHGFLGEISPDRVRATVTYEQVEGWLRRYMAGRPEVIG